MNEVLWRKSVDQHRHEAGADCSKEHCWIGRRVVQKEKHAIAQSKSERFKCVSGLGGFGAQLAIAGVALRGVDCDLVGAACLKIAKQDLAGVVSLRDAEADFLRPRSIVGDMVHNRVVDPISHESVPHYRDVFRLDEFAS